MTGIRQIVEILIPVFNEVNEIDVTLQSIWNQNYEKEDIFIVAVDFGSTDGSYEKLLSYPTFHFGVYQYKGDFTERTKFSLAAGFLKYQYLKERKYSILLQPGDIIYPDYIKKMLEAIETFSDRDFQQLPYMVVSEVDIKRNNGKIIHRKPLYPKEKLLIMGEELERYQEHTYQRNVICFGGKLEDRRHRMFSAANERIWYSKVMITSAGECMVYVPERLACIKERFYEDELEEILLRWESLLYFTREQKERQGKIDINRKNAEKELALYSLWRSLLLKGKHSNRQAEECYQVAAVIYPEIEKMKLYEQMWSVIMEERHADAE